jgi:hypothetical protein
VELIPDHPLARGLGALWLLNGDNRDYSPHGNILVPTNAPPVAGSSVGPSTLFNGTNQLLSATNAPSLKPPSITVVSKFFLTDASGADRCLIGNWYSNTWEWRLYTGGSTSDVMMNWGIHITADGQGINTPNGAHVFAVNTWETVAATYDATSGATAIYANGKLAASGGAPTGGLLANNGYMPVGATFDGGALGGLGWYWQGQISLTAIYNYAMSPAEAAWLAAEPFAMLREIAPPILYSFAGGGPTYVTFALASLRMATQPLAVNAETSLSIAERTLAMTPHPLGTNAETGLAVTLASLRMTPAPLAVNAETSLSVAERTLTMAPHPLGVNAETSLPISGTSLHMTANPLTVVASIAIAITRAVIRMAAYPFAGFGGTAAGGIVRGIVGGIIRGIVRR